MTDRHRIPVAIPYVASIVPKGGRRPRDQFFRTSTTVEIEVVQEPPVAVICRDGHDETAYRGHAGSLWLPVDLFERRDDAPFDVENAFRCFADGLRLGRSGDIDNPFLRLCREPMSPLAFRGLGQLEERLLRSVESDGRAEMCAAASRVAEDFLLTTDGTLLRRSPGPFWGTGNVDRIDLWSYAFDLPPGRSDHFAFHRREEAIEFARNVGHGEVVVHGDIEIVDPDCTPDRDAEATAQAIFRREVVPWFDAVLPTASPQVLELGKRAMKAFERIHGLPLAFMEGVGRFMPTPAGAVPPTPIEIAHGVEALSAFIDQMPGGGTDLKLDRTCADWRSVFFGMTGLAMRRYDDHERHRLPDPAGVPDLSIPSGPTP